MSSKKRDKSGPGPRKQPATPKEGDGFFRPFAALPKPAPPAQPSNAPQPKAARPTAPTPSPRPATKPAKPAPPTEDDLLTFDRLMGGVVPLDRGPARRVPTSGAPVRADRDQEIQQTLAHEQELEVQARARFRALVDEGSRFEIVDDGRQIEGRRRGVDGGLVRRMKHGELPVDATLDLHGMRLDPAREAVETFVRDRRAKGDRVVVIVHGRGRNSPAGQSVLRGEVAAWLSEGKSCKHVSAFVTAPPEHGGEGALCVLLVGADDRPARR